MNDPLRTIDDYLEGTLPADDCAALATWIKASPDNAAVFADKSALHARLADVLAKSPTPVVSPHKPDDE